MDPTEAEARLRSMLAADQDPLLSDDEVAELLAISQTIDDLGNSPSEDSYTATWNLNFGAAEGWRRKAGKAASGYDFTGAGEGFKRSQIVDNCLRMASRYAAKCVGPLGMHTGANRPLLGSLIPGVETSFDEFPDDPLWPYDRERRAVDWGF